MSQPALYLHRDAPDEVPDVDSVRDADQQVRDGLATLDLPPDAYLHLPYRDLDAVLGGWAPGEIHFACAFSGGGKTLFVSNVELDLLRAGKRIYHIGLETKPALVRLHMACLRLGVFYGDVVSGALKDQPHWPELADTLRAEVRRDRVRADDFIVNNAQWLNVQGLTAGLEEAAALECDLVVIDHVDHLATPDNASLYQASVATIKTLHALTVRHGLRVLALSQLNNDAVRADRLAVHMPPRPEQVYMGSHKRHVATSMLGIYRPLSDTASPETLKAVREGRAEPSTVIEPNVMALVCMKNRNYGSREGKRVLLSVDKGRLSNLNERDRYTSDAARRGWI